MPPPQRWEGANFTASAPGAENPIYATASLAELCRGKLDTLLDNRMLRDARPQQQQQQPPPQWWWGGWGDSRQSNGTDAVANYIKLARDSFICDRCRWRDN